MPTDELRRKVLLLLGKGRIEYVPSKKTVESIIEKLIEEGKIPPREKWEEIKRGEKDI